MPVVTKCIFQGKAGMMLTRELLIATTMLVLLSSADNAFARASLTENGTSPTQSAPPPPVVSKPAPVKPPVVRRAPPKNVTVKPPKSKSYPQRKRQAPVPVVATQRSSWKALPDTGGLLILTNGQGVSLTSRENGAPLLIVSVDTRPPVGTVGTTAPVNFMIDGNQVMVLSASVTDHGLYIDDPRLVELESRLINGRALKVVSAFAVHDVSLMGLRDQLNPLSELRRRLAMTPVTSVASTTVVEVNVSAENKSPNATRTVTPEPASPPSASQQPQTAMVTEAPAPETEKVAETVSQLSDETQLSIMRANEMNKRIADLATQIDTLSKVLQEQQNLDDAASADDKPAIEQTILAINVRIETLKKEYREKETVFNQYLTSLKPNDRDLYITARKASQLYPKVPYYIPGTSETGEFWVEPKVSDAGELMFNFRFIDPGSENDTTRSLIDMNLPELEQTQQALSKLYKNSKIAHENKIRENYSNRVVCFPTNECPPVRQKGKPGQTSTEILFVIYEDGSTAGRLQHNKGPYQEGVNFSIDSALLLQAYLAYVIKEARLDFDLGTRTPDQLDKMFQ